MIRFTIRDMVQCIEADEKFEVVEFREKMEKLGIKPAISTLRRKINDLQNRGLLTRVQNCPAVYVCNGHQLKAITNMKEVTCDKKWSREGGIAQYKKSNKPKNVKTWGDKIIGYPGETVLMIGCPD
jgi:hypothetical protein